jgi:hypothetical protein
LKSTGLVKLTSLWETVDMPKKPSHQGREAQKLVDRIEKKVSDQRLAPPKRNLRVVKWLRQVPAIGVCTFCNRHFKVPMESMKRVADAQWNLDLQFKEHKCKPEDASQAAARIVREATDKA